MPLKAILDNLDELEEGLHGLYAERDGKFILQIEGIDAHPAVRNLKTAHETVKKSLTEAKARVTELEERVRVIPEEFDPEEYTRLKANADPKGKEQIEQHMASQKKVYDDRIAAMTAAHERERQTWQSEVQARDKTIDDLLIDDNLNRALLDANVDKDLMDGAALLLRRSIKVVREEGKRPEAVFETDLGDEPIGRFVQNWVQSDKGKRYRAQAEGDAAPGGHRPRPGADNPFDTKGGKVKLNLQKIQEHIVADPEKARKDARAAGYPITW